MNGLCRLPRVEYVRREGDLSPPHSGRRPGRHAARHATSINSSSLGFRADSSTLHHMTLAANPEFSV